MQNSMSAIEKNIKSAPIANFATYSKEKLFDEFKTSLKGLASLEAKKHLQKYGLNIPVQKK